MSKILTLFFVFFVSILPSTHAQDDDIEIISRAAWGANETYRYLDGAEWRAIVKQRILDKKAWEEKLANMTPEERLEYGKSSAVSYDISELRNTYLLENFGEDIALKKTTSKHDGHALAWKQKYTNYVNSIVIHHTEGNYEDSYDAINKIYKYHAINRQWGDIGYNYLIGLDGGIFEGRAGGDYVVGAHNKWNNRSTVGVALIGSYQSEEPSDIQLESLEKLILHLSKKYGIDMDNQVPIHNTCTSGDCPKSGMITRYFYPLTGHRDGGHTACPGNKLYDKINSIRESISEQTLGFEPVKNPSLELAKVDIQAKIRKFNTQTAIAKKIETTNAYNAAIKKFNILPWDKIESSVGRIPEKKLIKNYIQIQLLNELDNGTYKRLVLSKLEEIVSEKLHSLSQVINQDNIGDDVALLAFDDTNTIKIKLSYPDTSNISIRSTSGYRGELSQLGDTYEVPFIQNIDTKTSFEQLDFAYVDGRIRINNKANLTMKNGRKIRIKAPEDGYLEIFSWERKPTWDTTGALNDNKFKGDIILYIKKGELVVVNQLPISDYLKGLGEVSDFEDPEKMRTIIVAARSYARWYTTMARKFEGTWYDGSDDPNVFQKYLGYGLEQRSPNINKIVDETVDQVITYGGELIKPWYHSSSDGKTISFKQYCKTAQAVPDCERPLGFPFLASVRDYSTQATSRKGHGVGIPGTGVKDLANRGWSYSMIIKYFLPGANVQKISNPIAN